jgi:hypothetical protein
MKLLRTPTTGAHKDLSLQISRGLYRNDKFAPSELQTPKLPETLMILIITSGSHARAPAGHPASANSSVSRA